MATSGHNTEESGLSNALVCQRAINAFLYYKTYAVLQLESHHGNYERLSASHKRLLPDQPTHFARLRAAIDCNYALVTTLVANAAVMFEDEDAGKMAALDTNASVGIKPSSQFYMEKVKTTIRQFYRDWSAEGAVERSMCYQPIIDEVLYRFPLDQCIARDVSILVPGAGLGRLAHEFAQRGYSCQGNEFSMYMLLASNFILNETRGTHQHVVYPWIHQFSNNWTNEDQAASVTIPDIDPSHLPELGLFSMAAGDFLDVYTTPGEWDCVACCFFIDTAHNVIDYLENIYSILKPGGYWINLGPLLYHYSEVAGERSIELSWRDIRRITAEIGFEILKEHSSVATYIQNPVSLHQMSYHCAFLVARKPARNHTLSRPSGTEPSAAVLPSREDTTPLNTQARVKGQSRIRGQPGVRVQAASTSAAARAPNTQTRGQASSSTAANTHTSSSLLEVAASRRGPSSIAPNTEATFTVQASSGSIAPNTEATGNCNGEWPGLD